jgi:hypothetical protein
MEPQGFFLLTDWFDSGLMNFILHSMQVSNQKVRGHL